MKYGLALTALVLTACQSTMDAPQSFADLLEITDNSSAQICTLPLNDLRRNLSEDDLQQAQADAFEYSHLIAVHADDPAAQIRTIFRRAALKRRLKVEGDNPELAQKFYDSFELAAGTPNTLKGFHDRFHYWMDRIGEQSDYGGADSAAFNLRFCIMNEMRAVLHAASRDDILARVAKGVSLPAPDLIENINHETSFDDGFSEKMLAQIFTTGNSDSLTPWERAKMRGSSALLPFDPKTAELFWEKKDEEIAAFENFISSHSFEIPADKLSLMKDMDLSLRRLLGGAEVQNHFENAEEFGAFKQSLFARLTKVDEFNTSELQKMLKNRGWFRDDIDGQGAANDAWLIAQHADRNPAFQQEALKLIEAELDAPGVSKSNYAYLYDRVQMRRIDGDAANMPVQRYGTQGSCSGPGTWEPFSVEEPERIDAVRAEVGLGTMAEYKSMFKDMCTEDQR